MLDIFYYTTWRSMYLNRHGGRRIMAFWSHWPTFSSERFHSALLDRPPIPSPTGHSYELSANPIEVQTFLRTYFGSPPRTPVLDLVVEPEDEVFVVRDKEGMVGCVRYHPMGLLRSTLCGEAIYLVDAFCVHPRWRGKGIAAYLLSCLHRHSNQRGRPHALFLKEGAPLPILQAPLYSGQYVYRFLTRRSHSCVQDLTVEEAGRRMQIFMQFQPDLFIIWNPKAKQQWKAYRKGSYHVLACVQDTHQRIANQTMGWVTAWFESPMMPDEVRADAVRTLTDTMSFDAVWMDRAWIGKSDCVSECNWIPDGWFHWYAYQWMTSLTFGRSYCLVG